ncbi:TorF family putative porin [Sapientia aquatica]|uniref:Uncharacterized protein n=1 Tax=Sapientia aquatica TaxID=1549640 RepID=A0A4R5VQI1_9BURK|nr:TorF family putative porin [Sapientia aquatica]TDK60532.1 hypothetical protein E2I14_18055 [Sapientia aquatica]
MLKKSVHFSAAVLLAVLAQNVLAQEAAEAPKPDNEVSFNLGATTDYRYRGISQSNLKPALQGGADYTNNPTGLYAGTWLSTIKWITDVGGKGDVEWDVYAGKRGEIVPDLSYDVGVLSYIYANNKLGDITGFVDANTTELYGQLTYKLANIKYSQSVTNLFGVPNSKNSGYVDLWTSIPLTDKLALGLHAGHQSIQNNSQLSYTDWKVGLSQDFFDVSFTLGVVGTNASKTLYVTPDGKFTGKTSLVLSASKTF